MRLAPGDAMLRAPGRVVMPRARRRTCQVKQVALIALALVGVWTWISAFHIIDDQERSIHQLRDRVRLAETRLADTLEAHDDGSAAAVAELQKELDEAHRFAGLFAKLAERSGEVDEDREIPAPSTNASHRLAIVVPFREDGGGDPLAQGIGRDRNLRNFTAYMCDFVKVPFDIVVVEQSPHGTWNKGKLFNVGFHLTNGSHDYMVLHDVDQIPENPENNYAWKEKPTLLLSTTSQWDYKEHNMMLVGGALQISHAQYAEVGGYSNKFEGWGAEDENMGYRLSQGVGGVKSWSGGTGKLGKKIGRYTALDHQRVMGLDETEQFGRNMGNMHDLSSGLDDVDFTYAVEKWTNTSCGDAACERITDEERCASERADRASLRSTVAALKSRSEAAAQLEFVDDEIRGPRLKQERDEIRADKIRALLTHAQSKRRCAWDRSKKRCVSNTSIRRALVRLDPPRDHLIVH
mmetsp:Transcript_19311/g.62949  ORF Transcript_19311/g.62949 Transcript_19311/m.62949 type:complete len:464 (-) Transcript_19311:175-1566(-)